MCHFIYLAADEEEKETSRYCLGSVELGSVPAHLVEEAVRLGHAVQLVFVLLQEVHVALLRDELQQLEEGGRRRKTTLFLTRFETGEHDTELVSEH